jgi:fructose/tagatose bisphosphate aldolase
VESGYAGNQNMVAWITSVVRSRDLIASLHLNHSPTFDKVVECIRDGYTTVMFDGSTLPLEQNLQLTRDVVRAGVTVEADVGTIGTTAEYGAEIENPHLADRAACEVMGETGIDALAVAISNAHGASIPNPNSTSTFSPKSDGAPKCHGSCTFSASERRRNRGGSPYGVVPAAVLSRPVEGLRPGRGRGIKLGWLPT